MATLTAGKAAEVLFTEAVETYEHQMQMLPLVDYYQPAASDMQNAGNFIWRPVQQHRPIISGWDVTGSEQGIIEETYPAVLGTPKNDIIELRIDDFRDPGFWERAGKESGRRQATELNQNIAQHIADTGSLFYQTNATSGYDAIAEAQTIMDERQKYQGDPRYMMLNDRDNLKYSKDLASRQTVDGRPEETWATGMIGRDVAGFEGVYKGSFMPLLAGGAASTTTTAAVSEAPQAGSVSATGVVTNVDYRTATIPVTASASFAVGDRVKFTVGGNDVQSVGMADKTPSGQAMTFTIVAIPNGTSVTVYPKPIALTDGALSTLELAYANINVQIASGATMTRLNTTASAKTNAFWCKSSVEVLGGDIPGDLMKEFGGMKHVMDTMSNGVQMHLFYDGNIKTANLTWRLFTWYGITNKDPSANGVFTTF